MTIWTEKYRPQSLEHVVLDEWNRKILNQIINTGEFPNLLFYGDPGTGKTTTIINLIREYQQQHHEPRKDLIIHLNASDDRGIDTIRNQIYNFVNSHSIFGKEGMKFVILDEVDYMTKSAQQTLKSIVQKYTSHHVRFCLICNYISRIEKSIQFEFMNLHFNTLPRSHIDSYLSMIIEKEGLSISKSTLEHVIQLFGSDMRSMVNYLQSNHDWISQEETHEVLNKEVWKQVDEKIQTLENVFEFDHFIYHLCLKYNMDEYELLITYFSYLYTDVFPTEEEMYNIMNYILHDSKPRMDYIIKYTFYRIKEMFYIHKNNDLI